MASELRARGHVQVEASRTARAVRGEEEGLTIGGHSRVLIVGLTVDRVARFAGVDQSSRSFPASKPTDRCPRSYWINAVRIEKDLQPIMPEVGACITLLVLSPGTRTAGPNEPSAARALL